MKIGKNECMAIVKHFQLWNSLNEQCFIGNEDNISDIVDHGFHGVCIELYDWIIKFLKTQWMNNRRARRAMLRLAPLGGPSAQNCMVSR